MPIVRFTWNPQLVDVRREACPRARWNKAARAWTMSEAEAHAFLAASHNRLSIVRLQAEIVIDETRWVIGFVRGAPMRSTH
ncbi:MAG: hypothetical protein AB7F35_00655 [Acetobacteraceae bacterium]